MDFQERLDAVGVTKAEFAERLGVSKQAVGNWGNRGLPENAEKLLSELERSPVDDSEPFPLGCLVETGNGKARVIRIDRCETFSGRHKVYWVSGAQETDRGWTWSGRAGQIPGKFLRRLPDPVWADGHLRKG